jgi:hypothetical protein
MDNINEVFHLAWLAKEKHCAEDHKGTSQSSFQSTRRMMTKEKSTPITTTPNRNISSPASPSPSSSLSPS